MTDPVRVAWEVNDERRRVHVGCGGVVTLYEGRSWCHRCDAVDSNGGWLRRLLMWNWHWLSFDGWPGWDLVGEGSQRRPPYAELTIIKSEGKSSLEIADEWDDVATGLFYSRDFTSDAQPYAHDGETYRAGFWFERIADRDAFVKRFGGTAR